MVDLRLGDCRQVLASVPERSIDACVTDPPYNLASIVKRFGSPTAAPARSNGATGVYKRASAGFMGQKWDSDVAFDPETWAAVWRVLKPGAHLLAFGGTRTYHRMVCAIEDAGFEIRDQIGWAYGSGFPKSLDVSKAIDKTAGNERRVVETVKRRDIRNGHGRGRGEGIDAGQRGEPVYLEHAVTAPGSPEAAAWQGWGTALKPAWEPIVVARKPLVGTVAANVLVHGTGALNIDGCRVVGVKDTPASPRRAAQKQTFGDLSNDPGTGSGWDPNVGRWPANLVHDGSDEVLACFPEAPGQIATESSSSARKDQNVYGGMRRGSGGREPRGDSGSAARFFYCAKASRSERGPGNDHPTVKPVALMRWLVRLVTPPGGTVLDPFAGSGTTGLAAAAEGFHPLLIEAEPKYEMIARIRLGLQEDVFA